MGTGGYYAGVNPVMVSVASRPSKEEWKYPQTHFMLYVQKPG